MNTSQYLAVLKSLENSHRTLLCSYCGCETPSIGGRCICSNCESFVDSTRVALERKNHVLLEMLGNINAYVRDSKYDDAIAVYEKLVSINKDPGLMYAESLLYLQYSNHELAKISYDRAGFMEENSLHRDRAAKLASSSKRLLAKGISIAESEISNGNSSPIILYSLFLCQMKMENYRGAQKSVRELEAGGSKYLAAYASMLFHAEIGQYKNAVADAESLLDGKNFSVNVLFYIGLTKFKEGHTKDAKRILVALAGLAPSKEIGAMIAKIEEQESIWK